MTQVLKGKKPESLNQLSWLIKPNKHKARALFIKAINELNEHLPSSIEYDALLILKFSHQIISDENKANKACFRIAQISEKLNSPTYLLIFEMLAHEQYGHEHLGITAKNIRPTILQEAKNLIRTHNNSN